MKTNKYQTALNRLYSLRKGIKNDYPFRKYDREAMKESLMRSTNIDIEKDKHALQELVDRNTPKLIEMVHTGYTTVELVATCKCPACKTWNNFMEERDIAYCSYCGQKLQNIYFDLSKINEYNEDLINQ